MKKAAALEHFVERNSPLGLEYRRYSRSFAVGLILSSLFALLFFIDFIQARNSLFILRHGERILDTTAIMPDFVDILGIWHVGYLVLAVCCLLMLPINYAYLFRGSKSIYTMRRLPDRFELVRRCIALPLLAAICSLAAMLVCVFALLAAYLLFTPSECLTPDQLGKLLAALL